MKIGLLNPQFNQNYNPAFKAAVTIKYDDSVDEYKTALNAKSSPKSIEDYKENTLLSLSILRLRRVIKYLKSKIKPQAEEVLPEDGSLILNVKKSRHEPNYGFLATLYYKKNASSEPKPWTEIDTCSQCYSSLPRFKEGYLSALSHETCKEFPYSLEESMKDYRKDKKDRKIAGTDE